MTRPENATEVKLVFDEPELRKKSPKHLADFSPTERRTFATELGLPAFRANQVENHYFTHFASEPETWTDIPLEVRTKFGGTNKPSSGIPHSASTLSSKWANSS